MNWFKKDPNQVEIVFQVEDMRCTTCEATIKIALAKVAGVQRVRIRHRHEVVVSVDTRKKRTITDLVKVVEATGYRVSSRSGT